MDNWHQYTQSNKFVKKYVEKFDEFIVRCSTIHKKGEVNFFLDSESTLEMTYELNY